MNQISLGMGDMELFEAYIRMYLDEAQMLVKRGLRSAYEEKTVGANSNNVTVSEADAKKTALDRVSGATDKDLYEWKLDYDDGRPEYEGKIIYGGTEYEFTIDAATGSVMEWDAEKVR